MNSLTRVRKAICLTLSSACLMTSVPGRTCAEDKEDQASRRETPEAGPTLITRGTAKKQRYRIGPGDVLEIRVFKRPELSRDVVRVDGDGSIRMPFVPDEIVAACRTEAELAEEVASRYKEYLVNPQVDVFVKQYSSQPVAVIGAVLKPGHFQLERRVRLRELLTLAGGPTENAGRFVRVVQDESALTCHSGDRNGQANSIAKGVVSIELASLLGSNLGSNPYLRPGDLVHLPEAQEAFVVGDVVRPTPIKLTGPITVSRAIAMAGGPQPTSKLKKVRIVRRSEDGPGNRVILIDLKAVARAEAEDPALQPDDIVEVPVSGTKVFTHGLLRAASWSTISYLPLILVR